MSDKISCTLKLEEDVYRKFKIMGAMSEKGMSGIFSEWVMNQKLVLPDFPKKKNPPVPKAVPPAEEEIKEIVLAAKAEGMTYQAIADKLDDMGMSTLSGRGLWNKGTISNCLKKWESQEKTLNFKDI